MDNSEGTNALSTKSVHLLHKLHGQ